MVVKTIINRPDASSWHRELLSKKFLGRLSAEHARDLMQTFAIAIQNKVEENTRSAELKAFDPAIPEVL